VLLLDEPTSALDPEWVGEVLDVIQRLAIEDGLTMIISTHQLRFADEVADRVVFLSGGSVVEEGPAHEVLTQPRHPLTAKFLSVMGPTAGWKSRHKCAATSKPQSVRGNQHDAAIGPWSRLLEIAPDPSASTHFRTAVRDAHGAS
jgi:ABC-type glutathione transport system ATPase component